MALRLYLKALGKHWWYLLGCALFTLIGLAALLTNRSNGWLMWVTAIAAIFLLIVASFLAWRDEHIKYEAEAGKNSRPEIRGTAFHFGVTSGIRCDSTPPAATFPIAFQVNVSNYRNVTTNIVEIDLDGSKLSPPIEFSEVHSPLVGRTLEFGIGVTGMPVFAIAHIKGMSLADLPTIKMDNLRVYVYDGFMSTHDISVNTGEDVRLT